MECARYPAGVSACAYRRPRGRRVFCCLWPMTPAPSRVLSQPGIQIVTDRDLAQSAFKKATKSAFSLSVKPAEALIIEVHEVLKRGCVGGGRAQGEMLHEYRKASEFSVSHGCAQKSNLPPLFLGLGTWRKVRSRGPRCVRNRSHPPPPPRCISGNNVCEPSSSQIEIRSTILRVTRRRRRS